MKVLKWYDVKAAGYYWMYLPDGTVESIQVLHNGAYQYHGLEDDFWFSEEEHGEYQFIATEIPKLPVAPSGYQEGHLNHQRNNGDSKFPEKVEGYWRNRELQIEHVGPGRHTATFIDKQVAELPWPYIWQIPQFDKQEFINRLTDVEDLAEKVLYRGFSICRITGVNRGNAEYEYKGWKWPAGLIEYVRLGVPPSRAFYAFIMGVKPSDCEWLPTYNGTEEEK